MVLKSSYPDLVVPTINLGEYVLNSIRQYPESKPALISAFGGTSYTFKELANSVLYFKEFLIQKGLKKGQVVALCCPNIPEFVVVLLGTALTGGIVTTCNPLFTEYELLHQLNDSQPTFVFTVPEHEKKLEKIHRQCAWLKEVFTFGGGNNHFSFENSRLLQVNLEEHHNSEINPKTDIVVLPYSSGTTGRPKGVMLSHQNFVSSLIISRINWKYGFHDVEYLVLPLFHIYGMLRSLAALDQGATVVLDQRFNIERAATAIETYKVTVCPFVPPMLLALAKSNVNETHDMSSLRTINVGAAPVAPGVLKSVARKLNCNVDQAWGMTETTGVSVIINTMSLGMNCQSSGKICDVNTGKEVGPNERGEILVKGADVMMGYYNHSAPVGEVFDQDGYFRTGDIGYYDELEQLYVVDRLKELIKYKAFQVPPAELEHVLMNHPKILDAAVIGVPDEEAGEVPKAFIVKKVNNLSKDEVNGYVGEMLSKYKQLYGGIEFVKTIPKSASGKILRRILRDQNLSKIKSKL